MDKVVKFRTGGEFGASGDPDTPPGNSDNIPHLMRAIPVIVSIKDGKVCNQMTARKRLERFDEVEITDEMNGEIIKTQRLWQGNQVFEMHFSKGMDM